MRGASFRSLLGLALCVAAILTSTPPAQSQAPPTVDAATIDGATLTITFSETLTAASSAVASDFSAKLEGVDQTATAAVLSGATLVLTMPVAATDPDCTPNPVTVSYTAQQSSLIGTGGGTVAAFSDEQVANETDFAPVVESISTDSDDQWVYIQFCESITDVSYAWYDFSAFTLTVDGASRDINDIVRQSGTPSRLDLLLGGGASITEGADVKLAYDQIHDEEPTLEDDNQGKLPVASWPARAVTNNVDGPPTLVSATARYDTVTLTFSEPLDEISIPDPADFSFDAPFTLSVTSVTISGSVVTLRTDYVLRGDGGEYKVTYWEPNQMLLRQSDGAHNVADFYDAEINVSTPNTKPTVQSASVDGASLTLTFDLPLKNVAEPSAFTINGQAGITVTATSFRAREVVLTLSSAVTAGAEITLTYTNPDDPPRIEGRNLKDADSFTEAVTNDTAAQAPVVFGASIPADGASIQIAFSLALDESADGTPAAGTFSLSGTAAKVVDVVVSDQSVTLTLDPLVDVGETVLLSYAQPTVASLPRLKSKANGKDVADLVGQTVSNFADGKPQPESATVDGATLTVSFNRPLDGASTPDASAFTIGGFATSVSHVAIAGQTLTLTISPAATHLDSLTLSYTPPTVSPLKRDGYEALVKQHSNISVTNNTPDPTPTFQSASVDATGQTLTIVQSHPLLATAAGTPSASAFSLTSDGHAKIGAVKVVGSSVELSLFPIADLNEALSIGYTPPSNAADPSLRSSDGAWSVAAWSAQTIANNADGVPRLTVAIGNDSQIALSFDRAPDSSSVPAGSAFTITPSGWTVSGVGVSDKTVTLTLSAPLEYDDIVSLSYSPSGAAILKRYAGLPAVPSFTDEPIDNQTPQPLINSIVGNGHSIEVTLFDPLDTSQVPAATAFSLGDGAPTVTAVAISGLVVSLTLDVSLIEGAVYTLTYTPPALIPLRKSDSSPVPSFSESVVNDTDTAPKLVSVVGDGQSIAISFDQVLDDQSLPSAGDFVINASVTVSVTGVSIADAALTLALSRALVEGESATLTYTQPAQGGIADPKGNRTDSFSEAVDNQTDTAPRPSSATINGDVVTIVLDQAIFEDARFAEPHLPPPEDFRFYDDCSEAALAWTVATVTAVNNDAGVGVIRLVLTQDVGEGVTFRVTYTPTSNVRIVDADNHTQRAEVQCHDLENVTERAPTVESASVRGPIVTVLFSEALDNTSLPPEASFQLAPPGPEVATYSIDAAALTLTLARWVTEGADYTIVYEAPSSFRLQDAEGSAVADFSVALTNETDYAPYSVEARTDSAGERIFLRFDQRLDPSGSLDKSWFSTSPSAAIGSVTFDPDRAEGDQLILQLGEGELIGEGNAVVLTYSAPSSGGLRDTTGNVVDDFPIAVTNNADFPPRIVSASVRHFELRIGFDKTLDPSHVPPPNCAFLAAEFGFDCDLFDAPDWFAVTRDGGLSWEQEFESIAIAGDEVIITLRQRARQSQSLHLTYQPQSMQGGTMNLRDSSSAANIVERADPISVENRTPSMAVGATIDRAAPDRIRVEFDENLAVGTVANGPFSVTADDNVVDVAQVVAANNVLDIDLAAPVAECVDVTVAYTAGNQPLTDALGHEVDGFKFSVTNLIYPDWGLRCVHSDFGGVVFSIAADAPDVPEDGQWRVTANGESRDATAERTVDQLILRPTSSVCVGDEVSVQESDTELLSARSLAQAAPCVTAAEIDGSTLTVEFDAALDPTNDLLDQLAPPVLSPQNFAVEGATVVAVESVSGQEVTLQLDESDLPKEPPTVTYVGNALSGQGLTVGSFAIEAIDVAIKDDDDDGDDDDDDDDDSKDDDDDTDDDSDEDNKDDSDDDDSEDDSREDEDEEETDAIPPVFESGFGVGDLVVLSFDAPLNERRVAASRFETRIGGIEIKAASVSIAGRSVTLFLKSPLPDDPDWFHVIYFAPTRGGLTSVDNAPVGTSVFVVRNYSETDPVVTSIVADTRNVTVSFDEPIDAGAASPADFTVTAGRRTIAVELLEWSANELTLTLVERVTALDVVRVVYAPSAEGGIVDTSGRAAAPFKLSAENDTPRSRSIDDKVADARIRASGGDTTLARELAREFASRDGIDHVVERGSGWAMIVRSGLQALIDADRQPESAKRVVVSEVTNASRLLPLIEAPPHCGADAPAKQVIVWRIDQFDSHGVQADDGSMVRLARGVDPFGQSVWCRLDLVSGEWTAQRSDMPVAGPAMIVIRSLRATDWLGWPQFAG